LELSRHFARAALAFHRDIAHVPPFVDCELSRTAPGASVVGIERIRMYALCQDLELATKATTSEQGELEIY